jgi:branched-chain amino acid transport system substrate-binding protein
MHIRKNPAALALGALVAACIATAAAAQTAQPIKIGLSVSLTGGVAVNGKQVLLAMQIWRDDQNAKGGLMGRPVELVFYDDQSNPTTVPGIYTKLIEIDKVDLCVGPYATNMVVPAIPVLMQHNMATVGITALIANHEFHYPKYFSMVGIGPDPKAAIAGGFFAVAMQQKPAPQTVAITATDAEFSQVSADAARAEAKRVGLNIVYDKSYPPSTTDFAPIVRAVQASNPDIVYNASYPPDTIGMLHAADEVGLKTKMFGGNMIGLVSTTFKVQLGPLLNGVISTADQFVPGPKFDFPGVAEVLRKYQTRAAKEGLDPLGYNFAPYSYGALQILAAAVEATKGFDQNKIAEYIHGHTFNTVAGEIGFGPDGEWSKARVLVSQFQHVKTHDVQEFKDFSKQVVVWPPEYKAGDLIYPYTEARK